MHANLVSLALVMVAACGAPAATAVPPRNLGAADPPPQFIAMDWMNREYKVFAVTQAFAAFRFKGGRYADSDTVLQLGSPAYLDLTGDGVDDALLPLQIDEAETALERGNPRFHSFLVFTIENGEVIHLGELPIMTCGPLRAEVEGEWLRIRSTNRGKPVEHMCGGVEDSKRYRWDGTWFVDEVSTEVDGKAT